MGSVSNMWEWEYSLNHKSKFTGVCDDKVTSWNRSLSLSLSTRLSRVGRLVIHYRKQSVGRNVMIRKNVIRKNDMENHTLDKYMDSVWNFTAENIHCATNKS